MEKLMQERELLKQCSGVDERKWIWPLLGTLTVNVATVIWAQICEWADMVEGDCESALDCFCFLCKRRSSARSEDGQVLEV